MAEYIIYDFINDNEIKEKYDDLADLKKATNEFYHQNFAGEEGYNSDKNYTDLNDCIELWECSGFGVARVINWRMK